MTAPSHARADASGSADYRAFHLGPGGHVMSAEVVPAASDDEAMALTAAMTNRYGIDLWERARFLASYPPQNPAEA